MIFIYNRSVKGYSHEASGTVCQDHSLKFIDNKYKIITACDGHGGKQYIRSDKGSMFASMAVVEVFSKYSEIKLHHLIATKATNKLKLEILCKWNELIEQDYSNNPFTESELKKLDEEDIFKLENNFVVAYGTTLNAAVLTSKYLVCIQIGDGGVFLLKKKKIEVAFPENDENVANITNSLCGDKAYNNLFINTFNREKFNGVIICSDGLLGPYQTYTNFYDNFVSPFMKDYKCITFEKITELNDFIDELASKKGIGDDVTFASILYDGIV